MIRASFPIKVYSGESFQLIENEEELSILMREYQYVRAAGGIIHNADGQVLMIHRCGVWDFPKGKAEEGETIEETALREVKEETGITARIYGQRSFSVFHTYATYGPKMLKETVWFEMEAISNQPVPQTEEQITEATWVNKSRVTELLQNSYASIKELWNRIS